jgi:RimJ/RimL family protein N-acetyltransferase
MELFPVHRTLAENSRFMADANCEPGLSMTISFFELIGYTPPWIGYFVQLDGSLVGSGAFKGKPKEGRVEIAYGTFPAYQHQGIGTNICQLLVQLALQSDPTVMVTARTLPEQSYSTRILRKNGFVRVGTV